MTQRLVNVRPNLGLYLTCFSLPVFRLQAFCLLSFCMSYSAAASVSDGMVADGSWFEAAEINYTMKCLQGKREYRSSDPRDLCSQVDVAPHL